MDGDEQAVHVEDGQCVDQHVAVAPLPVVFQHLGVGQQVGVGQHRALAAPGGAAGVNDGGQRVGAAGCHLVLVAVVGGALQQAAAAVLAQREHMARAGLERELADPTEVLGAADDHRRLGVGNEVADLGRLVGRIQRQKHVAGAQRGQVQQHGLHRFFYLHRNARPGRQLE